MAENATFLWILPRNALLGGIGPQKALGHCTGVEDRRFGFRLAPNLQFSWKLWKFMKFHEISWNVAKFPERRAAGAPESEKVDLALHRCPFRVVIFTSKSANFHDFHGKVEFSWISWNFSIFTKTALFAPKCTLGHLGSQNHQYSLSYGRNSASGRKSALFREKPYFLLIFTLFAKITFFMIFMIFMKNMNFRIMQDKQGRKSAKKCNFMIFMKFPWKSQNPWIFRISRNFDKIIKQIRDGDFALFSNENQWNLGTFQHFRKFH